MGILIKEVRIRGFRGLENFKIELGQIIVLTGINNTGKTTLLKAIQIGLGNYQYISQEDYYTYGNTIIKEILIDILIVPTDEDHNECKEFSDDWEEIFTTDRLKYTSEGNAYVPLRTIINPETLKNRRIHHILNNWPEFKDEETFWYDGKTPINSEKQFNLKEIPFFYIDAQRDILDDIKKKTSFFGKMLSEIKFSSEDIGNLESQIQSLNENVLNKSEILTDIKTILGELNSAMDTQENGVEITPFTKKIRDLNKGITIYYKDNKEPYSMEYHGMGTRSWSSLLTLKAFINMLEKDKETVFFPILAIEEPEAHLHPNAQKKLYSQIETIYGQKIISTHSPYVATGADINQIRNLYKYQQQVECGRIKDISDEDKRKIKQLVIKTRAEIFYSKMVIFFEGTTEEFAFPIFAEEYFNLKPYYMGINFIGVGGYGGYLPFLNFCESFNLPWIIFSDGENTDEKPIKKRVKEQIKKSITTKKEEDCVVFLDEGNNFETQLIKDGYKQEIIDTIKKIKIDETHFYNDKHKLAKISEVESETYDLESIKEYMKNNKTKFGAAFAKQIIDEEKNFPPKVIELFNKIKIIMNI